MRWRSYVLALVLALGLLPVFIPVARATGADVAPAVHQTPINAYLGLPERAPVTCQPDLPCAPAALVGMPMLQWVTGADHALTTSEARAVPARELAGVVAQALVLPELVPPRRLLS